MTVRAVVKFLATVGLLTMLGLAVAGPAVAASEPPSPLGACGRAGALVAQGALQDARDLAASVSPECLLGVEKTLREAETVSSGLSALAAGAKDAEKNRLATLALSIDNGNGNAKTILETPKSTEPCAGAENALKAGELARAKTLFESLKDDDTAKQCRTKGLAHVADAEQSGLPTRITRFLLEDARSALLLALVAFAIGVVFAGSCRRVRLPAAAAWVLTSLTLVGVLIWQWIRSPDNATGWGQILSYTVLLGAAVLSGFLASNAARAARPVAIAMGGKTDTESVLAAQTVAELQALGVSPSSGVFAMAGTDIAKSGLSAALEQVTNPIVKAVLAIWNAVQLGAGDRVQVVVSAPSKAPICATVSVFEGRHLVQTQYVDGAEFCLDRAKPTDHELAQTGRDVATGIAATLLLWKVKPTTVKAKKLGAEARRLYGASRPMSVALAAVAARRMATEQEAAALLYSRAVDLDSANNAARFGYLSARLRGFPEKAEARRRIDELRALLKDVKDQSPLRWRILYNLGAAEANVAVAEPGRNMTAAIRDLAKLTVSFPSGRGLVVDSDEPLWENLNALATSAVLGLRPHGANVLPIATKVNALVGTSLSVSRERHAVVACGLALAFARTDSVISDVRRQLSEGAVERLRRAGETPARRKALLDDPFTELIANTRAGRTLRAEWTPKPTVFDGLDAFGDLAPEVAAVHPTAGVLAARLATVTGRSTARSAFGVDDRILDRWAGAARWLAAGRPAARINLYQEAGYADADAVRRRTDVSVVAALAATAKLTGVSDLPDAMQRSEMAV